MELITILRAAAVVGGVIWGIDIVRAWLAYNELPGLLRNVPVMQQAKNSLWLQTIASLSLIGFGALWSSSKKRSDFYKSSAPPQVQQDTPSIFIEQSGYDGDRQISNDAYKLYLVKEYDIERNAVFDQFVCNEKLFDSVEDALAYADELENSKRIEKANSLSRAIELDKEKQNTEMLEIQRKLQSKWFPSESERAKERKSSLELFVVLTLLICALVAVVKMSK